MGSVRGAAGAVLLVVTIITGCSSAARQGREHAVFEIQRNIGVSQRANVSEIVDVGVARFRNMTSRPVSIRSIRLVRKPSAVHFAGVRAFSCVTMGGCVFTAVGDMTKECPRQFKPITVNRVIVPAHKYTNWQAVVAIRVSQPGRWHLGRVRIDYVTDGIRGWQYQNLWFTAIIANPPRPGGYMAPSECPP